MFLSRVTLDLGKLTPEMMQKWQSASPYASHQWLWQLFLITMNAVFCFAMSLQNGASVFMCSRMFHLWMGIIFLP